MIHRTVYLLVAFLSVAGALSGAYCCCGTVPYPSNTGYSTPTPIIDSPLVWSFESEPTLHPMKIQVNRLEQGTSNGLIFLAPYGFSQDAM